jgi:predicted nucleic acid-binding protein
VTDALLVDTDVFSFTLKHDSRRLLYAGDLKGRRLAVSVMTVAEVKRWPLERNWGAAKRRLLDETLAKH